MSSKQAKHAAAVLDAKPGGPVWDEASASARVMAAAIYELSSSLAETGEIAQAIDKNLDHTGGMDLIAQAIEAGCDRIAQATSDRPD